jgi:hypothetical protein
VYFIGNSLTDNINYEGLGELARSRGIEQVWGRHMIPGAPLRYILSNPEGGFRRKPYGGVHEALGNHAWDAVTVQPFDRKLDSPADQADLPAISEIIDLALKQNPHTRILIHAHWPRIRQGGKSLKYDANAFDPSKPGASVDLDAVDPYGPHWEKPYSGGYDGTNETRDYYDKLAAALRARYPEISDQIVIVPVGEVLFDLDAAMRAGRVPGYRTIHQFYKDTIHLNALGSYTTACVFFAAIYGQTPVGLPTAPYGEFPPEIVHTIQEAVARHVPPPTK